MFRRQLAAYSFVLGVFVLVLAPLLSCAAPRVIVISLDGATPRLVNKYLRSGALPADKGIGLLRRQGASAKRNITTSPSLTAAAHIAIATGSSAQKNDVVSNMFSLVASPFGSNISGFAAPIGGYSLDGPDASKNPTARSLWMTLREHGKTVVTATFPGADGIDVKVPGLATSPIIQTASIRTADYTVPFGEFAGLRGRGFTLIASDFWPAPDSTVGLLTAAGKNSFSPVLQKITPLDTFSVEGVIFAIQVAALDTTDDSKVNYDTLVFFNRRSGFTPLPSAPPPAPPMYVKPTENFAQSFALESTLKKAGCSFYVTRLEPDLSVVHVARSAAYNIPSNAAVRNSVNDINTHVGFWSDPPDYRFLQRLNSGTEKFSDSELEAIFEEQAERFVDYQTRVALRAIEQNPNADLVMIYIEQPDGSEHQFLLTDKRQATDPHDPNSIRGKQDRAKMARYQSYVQKSYQISDNAVQRIIDAVGVDDAGRPKSDVFVVSDHGVDPFFSAVSAGNLLASAGIDSGKVRAIASGGAVHVYINLKGREPDGTVGPAEYIALQNKVANLFREMKDTNHNYGSGHRRVFDKVFTRPSSGASDPNLGRGTDENIGQDSGDIYALLTDGYGFDGVQSPAVQRLGDSASDAPVFSVPSHYGTHGYDPKIEHMSAIFFAAGPDIRHAKLGLVHNIDVAPTVEKILGVPPHATIEGHALTQILEKH